MNSLYTAPEEILNDVYTLNSAVLFGSRSMASRSGQKGFDPEFMIGSQISEATDWDFSAPYSEANHDALEAAGFTYYPTEQLAYADCLTVGVYIKRYIPSWAIHRVEDIRTANVVLRTDHRLFVQVWNSIDPQFYYKYIWKRGPTYRNITTGEAKDTICGIMNQLFTTARHMI